MIKFCQTFFLDPSVAQGASEAGITRIDLFFRGKPKYRDNRSGIENPGVEVWIAGCVDSVPVIGDIATIRPSEPTEHGARFTPRQEVARLDWAQIQASTDAKIPTSFVFNDPQFLKTGKEYAVVIKFDGGEDFLLWTSVAGAKIVGTETVSPGPSGKFVGKFYTYIGPPDLNLNPTTVAPITPTGAGAATTGTTGIPSTVSPAQYLLNNWRDNVNEDLKFQLSIARFAVNRVPIALANINLTSTTGKYTVNYRPELINGGQTLRITAPNYPTEFITYNVSTSTVVNPVFGARVFQIQPFFPGGKAIPLTAAVNSANVIAVAPGSYAINATTTFAQANGFSSIFAFGAEDEFIVFQSANNYSIHKVKSLANNNPLAIVLDSPPNFTNAACYFYKAPVGLLIQKERAYVFGGLDNIITLTQSNANATNRFVNNQIISLSSNGGTGYSNSDVVTLNGFENVAVLVQGGYPAKANVVTNGNGTITACYMSNSGAGFQNVALITGANISISNSTGGNTAGSNATFIPVIGSRLGIEFADATQYFSDIIVRDLDAARIKPEITVNQPAGTTFESNIKTMYYKVSNSSVVSGRATVRSNAANAFSAPVKIFKSSAFDINAKPSIPSRSNEYNICYSNGALANASVIGKGFSNSVIYTFDVTSNNDFTHCFFEPDIIHSHYSKYIINNDYTNENTNYGNALAKHVTTKVNLSSNNNSEDLVAYLTAYRPSGTDIKVFARIHNPQDDEAFDDKDWTLLDCIGGNNLFSSVSDTSDMIELTYSFNYSPNTVVVTTTGALANTTNNVLTGANLTSFSAGDVIKISPSLFPNSNFITVVNAVTNATSIILNEYSNDNNVVGSGLVVEKILYPRQAFKYRANHNVVRYYSNVNKGVFETFDTFQLKIVMLASDNYQVPKIDDVRTVAVTS